MSALTGVPARVRERATDPLARTSLFTILTTVVTAGLGYLYWIAAAHLADASTIGIAASAMTMATGAALATNVGTSGYFIERLPPADRTADWRETVAGAFGPTLVASGVVAVLVQTMLSTQVAGAHRLEIVATGTAASVGLTFVALLDTIFIASRRASVATLLGVVLGLCKLAFLVVAWQLGAGVVGLMVGWALGLALSSAIGALALFPRLGRGRLPLRFGAGLALRDVASVLGHHVTSLGGLMVPSLLPSLVVARLGAVDGAYFYTTWMMGSLFFMISPAVSNSLFAEGSRDRSRLAATAVRALQLLAVLLPVPVVLGIVAGRPLLSMFGPGYAEHGRVLLVLFALAAFPDALTNVGVAVLRSSGRLRWSAALNIGMGLIALVGSWLLMPAAGIVGAGLAWLASQLAGTLAVAPLLFRLVRGRPGTTNPDRPGGSDAP